MLESMLDALKQEVIRIENVQLCKNVGTEKRRTESCIE